MKKYVNLTNLFIQIFRQVDFQNDYREIETSSKANEHLENVKKMRKDCEDFRQKTKAQMIRKHAKQNKVSEYHVGETVLVQNEKAKSRRGKNMLDQIPTFEGKIIKKNNNRYRIQYENDNGERLTKWFGVTQVSSLTKFQENNKKKSNSSSSDTQHVVGAEPVQVSFCYVIHI